MTPEASLSSEEVRRLRGDRSRAAFARLLGVTPLTVYRWELPDDAAEARRPRGPMANWIRQAAAGQISPDEPHHAAAGRVPSAAAAPVAPAAAAASIPTAAPAIPADEFARLLPISDLLHRADFRRAEEELLSLLSSSTLRSHAARAEATVGLAHVQLIGRHDARGAFSTVLPLLADAEAGRLPTQTAAHVHALAALLFGDSDGRLYDLGKVNAHVAAVERLLETAPNPELLLLARLGQAVAGMHTGDVLVATRGFEAIESLAPSITGATHLCALEEARGLRALVTGKTSLATQLFAEVAERAAALGWHNGAARALSFLASRKVDDAAEPAEILQLARRAADEARAGSVRPGIHSLFVARAEGEALIRMARFDEALRVLEEGRAIAGEMAWTPVLVSSSMARAWVFTGRYDRMIELGRELRAYDRPVHRQYTNALGLLIEGMAHLVAGTEVDAGIRLVDEALAAAEQGGSWPFFARDALIYAFGARVVVGDRDEAHRRLRRTERFLEQHPSAAGTALLLRFKARLLLCEGRYAEGKQAYEASLGTFTLAGDLPEAAYSRRSLAILSVEHGEPGAEALLAESDAELARLGMVPPHPMTAAAVANRRAQCVARPPPAPNADQTIESLVVPVARLAVRGVGAPLIRRELASVLGGLFPGRRIRIGEVDSNGRCTVFGDRGTIPTDPDGIAEFGDGCGRRLRVSIEGPLSESDRGILAILTQVASLSLEVASLRGFGELPAPASHEQTAEVQLKGFIAASPAMRRLRRDLGQLSASRSTVIVTGESGSGKEVVARAIHDLSERAGRPYVAFNCAAVPRELFEGQLFGYRKGAFTGATSDHPGVIRAAHGGTLFLDEIGELPLELQPKLLRFLENGEVFPLGEKRPASVDVRVIAATHRDLAGLVRAGTFREDLFYRLQVVPVRVPPLRERREDVEALARHFVRSLTPPGMEPPLLAPDALAKLLAWPWRGNVRELRNVIERSLAFGPLPRVLTSEQLRLEN